MNLKQKILILASLLVLCQITYTQENMADKSRSPYIRKFMITRSAPTFTLQLNFDYNQAILELAGTYNDDFRSVDYIKGQTFGADKGFGANITSKITLSRKGNLRLLISASYNRIMTYMFGKGGLADIGETKFNTYTGGIGFEHNFTPNYNFKLYAAGEFLASMINGNALLWVKNTETHPEYSYNMKIENSFRLGVSIAGGTEYLLTKDFGLHLGFKFTLANLFLRQSETVSDSSSTILLDGKPDVPGNFLGRKNYGFFTVFAGIVFYWGIIEKQYELK